MDELFSANFADERLAFLMSVTAWAAKWRYLKTRRIEG
jgi:hypothetical protein